MKYLFYYSLVICVTTISYTLQKDSDLKKYPFTPEPLDVIFVSHEKDIKTLPFAIEGIRKNVPGIRRIIVVSEKKLTDKAEWFDEAEYPFSKIDIAKEIFISGPNAENPQPRIGWVYQQLLKLYSFLVIPNLSSNILIVDSDTIFLNKTTFMDEEGNPYFNPGYEYYQPYFDHAIRLLPSFKKIYSEFSGISHHMLFQRSILEDLFTTITNKHHTEPWIAICRCIDIQEAYGCPLSEYEIYFNFIFSHTNQAKLHLLKWANVKFNPTVIDYYRMLGYHYISCHAYL